MWRLVLATLTVLALGRYAAAGPCNTCAYGGGATGTFSRTRTLSFSPSFDSQARGVCGWSGLSYSGESGCGGCDDITAVVVTYFLDGSTARQTYSSQYLCGLVSNWCSYNIYVISRVDVTFTCRNSFCDCAAWASVASWIEPSTPSPTPLRMVSSARDAGC